MQAHNKQKLQKIIVPAFYIIAMALMVFNVWNDYSVRHDGDSPLYRDLMNQSAYIRRGFDPEELTKIPALDTGIWFGFKSTPLIVKNSLLPDLPKRTFLSPFGHEAQEFTIIIPVEIDWRVMSIFEDSLRPGATPVIPGIFLGFIGENWEVLFNGTPVRSEMHLNDKGQIRQERTLRSVYFPVYRQLVKQGTNIIALRIIGDPTSINAGLFYNAPHYMDDYRIIQEHENKYPLHVICSIFGFTGVYCLILFFYFRNRREIFYLFFSIFSILVCTNITMRHGLLVQMTNSFILFRLEFASIMLAIPVYYMFIESLGRGKTTKPTWGFLFFSLYFAVTQIFFCNQYGVDAVYIWSIVALLFFTYVIFYDIIYFYFFDKKRNMSIDNNVTNSVIVNIIVGTLTIYFCAIYEAIDIVFLHNSYSIFPYSAFIVLVGMSFAMQQRFTGMYKRLERSNIMLEADFAHGIISSGQKHYQKMNSMYETLRILRHDYKYHLRAIGDLVKSGDIDGVKQYLAGVQSQAPENEIMIFCSSPVINGLLSYYAERCVKLNISYNFLLTIPDTLSVSNHEMCIILGNLLENAVEACQKIVLAGQERTIELAIKTQGIYIAVMVKNSFSGEVVKKNGHPVSTKENGGFGLQSVRIVAGRYNGYVHPRWNKDTFTIYVMLRM